jgi:ectoine hydroxylase-related dioxygenase (phytanoyl-CoA dioxygenase family)
MVESAALPDPINQVQQEKLVDSTSVVIPPPVDIFDATTVTSDDVTASLIRSGGCIVRQLISTTDVAQLEEDTRTSLDADAPWKGSFFPQGTRRAAGLAGKSLTFVEKILGNPLYQQVCKTLLTSKWNAWYGTEVIENISLPHMNSAFAVSIPPGAPRQELHRDDMNHHNNQPAIIPEQYVLGRDTAVGLFVAGKKATKENGTTRFIPGSHLQASTQAPDRVETGVFYA